MNRLVNTFATNATRKHQNASQTVRRLLIGAITLALFSSLYLFIGGSATPSPTPLMVAASPQTAPLTTAKVREAYGQLPLSFEANRGQADEAANFVARGAGYTLSLSPTQAAFALARQSGEGSQSNKPAPSSRDNGSAETGARRDTDNSKSPRSEPPPMVLRMNIVGANRGAGVEGLNELEGKVNYFTGKDPSQWRTNIQTFGRVRYTEVYPGIDVVYYGNQRQLEYDFVVAPGRNASAIALEFAGADKVEVDAAGELLLKLGESVVRQPKPYVYQEVAGERRVVEGGYLVQSDGRVGFALGEYDAALPLVIDPVLIYSTYLGGSSNEEGRDIAVDSAGNAYICGNTNSTNFPVASPFQSTFGGANFVGARDAFVTKINAAGTAFVYSTYLGGSSDDRCGHMTVDSAGNAYIAGETNSTDFPTVNAIQTAYGGGLSDAFVTKMNAAGSALVYSTFVGGTIFDAAAGIAIDSSNNAYITGRTTSTDYPVVNAIQAAYSGGPGADAFVTKINAAGDAYVYSTYLGGSGGGGFENGSSIAVDSAGIAYVTGQVNSTNFPVANAIQATFGGGTPGGEGDAFVTKVNAAGDAFVYSTYLGGSADDVAFDVAVDSAGNAHVTGSTFSTLFPLANAFDSTYGGDGDAFVTKINAAGNAYIYSTYLGGTFGDSGNEIALDSAGNAYIAGGTSSTNFPLVNPVQSTLGGGTDAFVTKLNTAGSALIYSTYFGSPGFERANSLVVDSAGNAYVTGITSSTNFPTRTPIQTANGGSDDAFVFKLDPAIVAPPVANNDAYNTPEDTALTVAAPGVLGNDTSANPLTAIIVTQPANGTVTLNSNGSFTYTPAANYNGPDSFTYKANNGADSNTATVSITVGAVNDAPTLAAISDLTINEDAPQQTVNLSGISAGGGESQTLSITATSNNTGLIPHPTVNYTSPNATGSLTFTPLANQSGSALITVTLTDSGGTANGGVNFVTRTFTVTVNAVNDAPVNSVSGAQTTNQITPLTFSAANSNLISISDIDAAASPVQVTLSATGGTLSLSGTAGLSFTTGDGTSDATMTFTGTLANINAALNGLVFTPTANFSGAASLQITTNDLGNTGAGGALSDTDNVAITVIAVRQLQLSSATYNVGEADGHATITVLRIGDSSQAASVNYATSDLSALTNCNVTTGNASQRCDYTAVAGTLSFISGQTSATFDVPIINDVYVEGPETLSLTLSNPTGGILGSQVTSTLTITDNDFAAGAPNPIGNALFFVRQHYLDFLNREPEPAGLQDWVNILQNCPAGDKRCDFVQVSSGFFRSREYFDRGYYIYRFYEVGLGRKPTYDEYQRDLRLVTGFLSNAELEARKQQFAIDFSQRAEFKALYDQYDSQTRSQEYVDALAATAGVTLGNRQTLAFNLVNSFMQRWDVLRAIVEGPEVSQKFFNKAFVVVGYFAYLRRDPDAQYLVWIEKLNNPAAGQSFEDTYREMIKGFIESTEYRARFGPN